MSRRSLQRIDHKEFNSTGKLIHVIPALQYTANNLNMDENGIKLKREITVLNEEILDISDENLIEGNLPRNVDAIVSRLEQKRTSLRTMINEFMTDFPEDYSTIKESYDETLLLIKDHIKSGKNYQIKVELRESLNAVEDSFRKERSTLFALEDIQRCIQELELEMKIDVKAANNETLQQWNKESNSIFDVLGVFLGVRVHLMLSTKIFGSAGVLGAPMTSSKPKNGNIF